MTINPKRRNAIGNSQRKRAYPVIFGLNIDERPQFQRGHLRVLPGRSEVFAGVQHTQLQLQEVVARESAEVEFMPGNSKQRVVVGAVGLGNLQVHLRHQQVEIQPGCVEGHPFHAFAVLLIAFGVAERLNPAVPLHRIKPKQRLTQANGKRDTVVKCVPVQEIIESLQLMLHIHRPTR